MAPFFAVLIFLILFYGFSTGNSIIIALTVLAIVLFALFILYTLKGDKKSKKFTKKLTFNKEDTPPRTEWTCVCGRVNGRDSDICECGKSCMEALIRREMKVVSRDGCNAEVSFPSLGRWTCTCGHTYDIDVEKCDCGKTRYDVISDVVRKTIAEKDAEKALKCVNANIPVLKDVPAGIKAEPAADEHDDFEDMILANHIARKSGFDGMLDIWKK